MDNDINISIEEESDEVILSEVQEWEDITLESHEDSFSMGNGDEIYVEEDIISGEEYYDNAKKYIDYGYAPSEAETIETVDGFEVKEVKLAFENRARVSNIKNLWTVSINNVEYNVLFNNTEDLKVIDGYLVNTGSTNITGVVVPTSGINLNNFSEYYVTILPIAVNSSQNTAYRYGSHSYLTRYYTNGTNNLQTDVMYYDVAVVKRPFGSQISFDTMLLASVLLLLVLLNFVGSIIRR